MKKLFFILLFLIAILTAPVFCGREVILEYKGAYFLPTNSRFKTCYKGTGLSGPELTVQLCENKHWYGFASLDYFKQDGRCLSICDATKLRVLPLGFGIKYFVPLRDWANLYLGLGFEAAHVKTKTVNGFITCKHTQWAFGGIAKLGSYISLPHHCVLDLFFDYSFIKTNRKFYGNTVTKKAHINGAIFGAGFGYRFN